MSDINLDFTVSNNSINFTVEPNDITITPTDVQLTVFAAGLGVPGGNVNELQYNDSGLLGGVANTSFSGGNLTLGDISNIKITGGTSTYIMSTDGTGNLSWTDPGNTNVANIALNLNANSTSNVIIGGGVNGYVLQTDGVGNLSWTAQTGNGGGGNGAPGGANRQIQYNDSGSFGGTPFFTFDEATGDVVVPNNLSLGSGFPLFGGNISGMYANFTAGIVGNTISGNISANGLLMLGTSVALFPTVNSLKIGGGLANYYLKTDGTGNLSWTSINFNVLTNGTSNVTIPSANGNVNTSVGGNANILVVTTSGANIVGYANIVGNADIIGNISTLGTTSIQQAKEKFTANSTGSTGTINYDILTQAIILKTSNATANFTLNFRGNSTTTLDSVMSSNQSMTCTFINTNSANAYYANVIRIDGTTITPVWAYPGAPTGGTPSGKDAYTFNILKTASNTYTVLASKAGFV